MPVERRNFNFTIAETKIPEFINALTEAVEAVSEESQPVLNDFRNIVIQSLKQKQKTLYGFRDCRR